jgi:hypothetical protein
MSEQTDLIEAPAATGIAAQPAPAQQRQLTIVEAAARSGATPEQLVQLFQLQRDADNHQLELMREKRRMDKEDREAAGVLAFRRDFAAFRGENIIIAKGKFVDRGKAGSFMQAEYHAASTLLSPALSRHGFSFRHNEVFGAKRWMNDGVESDVPWVYVTCYLEHRDGHSETLDLEGPPGDMTANTPVQNMQVTASYLKRQSLLAITGTATGGEDDENGMRGKRGQTAGGDEQQQGPDETLLDAGRAEAMKGMPALTAWWGALTAKQRSAMNNEFGALRKCATQAGKEGAR